MGNVKGGEGVGVGGAGLSNVPVGVKGHEVNSENLDDNDDDNDDDFDPDVWRRRQKKLLRAQRVAEANSRWGFTSDGLQPSIPGDPAPAPHKGQSTPQSTPAEAPSAIPAAPAPTPTTPAVPVPAQTAGSQGRAEAGEKAAVASEVCGSQVAWSQEPQVREPQIRGCQEPQVVVCQRQAEVGGDGARGAARHSLLSLLTKGKGSGGGREEEDFSEITLAEGSGGGGTMPSRCQVRVGGGAGKGETENCGENANGNLPADPHDVHHAFPASVWGVPTRSGVGGEGGCGGGVGESDGGGQGVGEDVLVGLGLTFNKAGASGAKGLVIKRMKPASPAMRCQSLRVGQCVVAIDGTPLLNIRNARDLAELTQGRPGTTSTLLVIGDEGGEESVVLVR